MISDEERHRAIVLAITRAPAAKVLSAPLEPPVATRIDLSLSNQRVRETDYEDPRAIERLVAELIGANNSLVGIGGYGEQRGWYARGSQFTAGNDVRSIHLGVDIWGDAGMPVFAPFDGVIHSLKDNALVGDYGPTVILTHEIEGQRFHCLFGHLSRESLQGKSSGDPIAQGSRLGEIGSSEVNGAWPPHLHLQIILDMLGKIGDFPGVATTADREYFLHLCPDPNLILRSSLLAPV